MENTERRSNLMQFKDFIDISTKAGCKIGSKTDFRNNSTIYTVEYNGRTYATAKWFEADKKMAVTFRDDYLKWYQTIIAYQYGWVEKKSDYAVKLAKVIKQNNKITRSKLWGFLHSVGLY